VATAVDSQTQPTEFRSSTPSTESTEGVEGIAAPSKTREDSAEDPAQGQATEIENDGRSVATGARGEWGGFDSVMADAERLCYVIYLK
jgi:hypothetical protein